MRNLLFGLFYLPLLIVCNLALLLMMIGLMLMIGFDRLQSGVTRLLSAARGTFASSATE